MENLISDEDELNDNPDYIKNKLNDEEKEILGLYINNSFEYKSNQYIKPYFELQEIYNPKKILKNELEHFFFNKSIYYKSNVIPQPGFLDNAGSITNNTNNAMNSTSHFINDSKIEKSVLKTNNNNNNTQNINQTNSNINNNSISNEKKQSEIPHIIDPNELQLVDYGEKTYERLCNYISKNNCYMWLGKLSPSIVENLWDNYALIVKAIHDRKTFLREKFSELMMEEEKKLDESDPKAKKHLLNVFLKGDISYEFIKNNYRNILSLLQGNNPSEEEEELIQEDEQFNYEMNILIDHFINEDFEIIDNILSGEIVKGKLNKFCFIIF